MLRIGVCEKFSDGIDDGRHARLLAIPIAAAFLATFNIAPAHVPRLLITQEPVTDHHVRHFLRLQVLLLYI